MGSHVRVPLPYPPPLNPWHHCSIYLVQSRCSSTSWCTGMHTPRVSCPGSLELPEGRWAGWASFLPNTSLQMVSVSGSFSGAQPTSCGSLPILASCQARQRSIGPHPASLPAKGGALAGVSPLCLARDPGEGVPCHHTHPPCPRRVTGLCWLGKLHLALSPGRIPPPRSRLSLQFHILLFLKFSQSLLLRGPVTVEP